MLYQETTRVRRIVGRLERGEEIVDSLTELCRENGVTAGEVRAIGSFSEVELVRFDGEAGEYVTTFGAEGEFDVVSLAGNVSVLGDELVIRLDALLGANGPAGVQHVSGQLRRGVADSCEFVLEIFEDLSMERNLDADSGQLVLEKIIRTEQPAEDDSDPDQKIQGKGMSWDDVASEGGGAVESSKSGGAPGKSDGKKSEKSVEEIYGDADLDGADMEPGDILEHPKLGRCRVMKIENDKFAHVRLPRGKIRKLSLDIVDVELTGEDDGRRVFEASINR